MTLTLGFSPCPNDTFIFDALVNYKIDTEGISFKAVMEDVQTLNERAIRGELDITKISYGSLPLVLENYILLNAGGALGIGVGPLLISRIRIPDPEVRQCAIAIPGRHTTANVLFSLAYPEATNKVFLRYDEIQDYALGGAETLNNLQAVKLGVIIHENRFTYQDKGLTKQMDLGAYWEKETGLPVPLGGIVARRDLTPEVYKKVDRLIRKSVQYAFAQGEPINNFIIENAMEMDIAVMKQHIDLYVNDFSIDLGEAGKEAVKKFIEVYSSINKIPVDMSRVFAL